MTSPHPKPWRKVTPPDPTVFPVDVLDARRVAEDQWVRIVPFAFSDFDVMRTDLHLPQPLPPPWQNPPRNPTLALDYKVVPRVDFFGKGFGLLCTETVLRALAKAGIGGFNATPVSHASPNPIRGARLHMLDVPGRLGPPLSAMKRGRRNHLANPAFGTPGAPIPPVVIDGTVWTGDPLCLTDWLEVDTNSPWRALIARGDFIRALLDDGANEPLLLQPVEVTNLPKLALPIRASGVWQPAAPAWSRPSGWSGAVRDHIVATAQRYRHFLPPPPDGAELERVANELEQRYQGKLGQELRNFMSASNGAALFAGMLTFFPVGPRSAVNAIPEGFACDDIVGGNERVGPDDWLINRAPGWILFASRFEEMHAMWALNPDGIVRLLHQSGEVLGPDIPFNAWLEDQVADLEWAWDNPGAFGRLRSWIDLSPSDGRVF